MDVFYALAEPTRRNILEILARDGQLSATAVSKKFPVSASAISQHLKVLREARLVRVEKRAQQRLYRLNPAAFDGLEAWTRQMTERFDALETVLEEEKRKLKAKEAKHGSPN